MTQREMASAIGISLGKLNYCLKALIEKGWVKVNNFKKSKNKLSYAYLLTSKGIDEKSRVTLAFLMRKQMEYDQLVEDLAILRREVAIINNKEPLE